MKILGKFGFKHNFIQMAESLGEFDIIFINHTIRHVGTESTRLAFINMDKKIVGETDTFNNIYDFASAAGTTSRNGMAECDVFKYGVWINMKTLLDQVEQTGWC